MRRAAVAALAWLALVAAPAGADVLCKAPNGRAFLRTRCKHAETGVELPKGPTGDPGPAASAPVRVVDSAGRPVGVLGESLGEDSVAVFEVGGRLVAFFVRRSGFLPGSALYHLTADCSDPPLAAGRHAAFVQEGLVLGTTAYYAGDPIQAVTPVAREFPPEDACGGGSHLPNGNCCTAVSTGEDDYGPATVAFDVSSLGLTPPFHLEP